MRKKTRIFRQLKGATCQLLLLVSMVHVENTENGSVGDEAGAATLEYIHVHLLLQAGCNSRLEYKPIFDRRDIVLYCCMYLYVHTHIEPRSCPAQSKSLRNGSFGPESVFSLDA